MTQKEYQSAIEAILFASGASVEISRIAQTLEISEKAAKDQAEILRKEYEKAKRGITIIKLDNSYQMVSVKQYAPQIRKAMDLRRNIPLSQAAMEVLAVIAYNQPVTKSFVEQVRGVDCSGVIGSLSAKGLIEEKGRLELPGRPLLYGTTENFLRCFSISSIDELPPLPQKSAQGETTDINEDEQLTVFEPENKDNTDITEDKSSISDKRENDDIITATVEDIIEQATTE